MPFVLWSSLSGGHWLWAACSAGVLLLVLMRATYQIHQSITNNRESQRRRAAEAAPIPPDLGMAILLTARVYAEPGTRVGVAASVPDEARAFAGALAAGPQILPEAHRLIADGAAAGRVYGARLVAAFDPEAAEATWRQLRDDPDTLLWAPGGCTVMNRAVAEIADWHLTHDDVDHFPGKYQIKGY